MALEATPEEMDQLTPRERRLIALIRLTVAIQNRIASGMPLARGRKRARAQPRRVRGAKDGAEGKGASAQDGVEGAAPTQPNGQPIEPARRGHG
jgi:hypothetical protein